MTLPAASDVVGSERFRGPSGVDARLAVSCSVLAGGSSCRPCFGSLCPCPLACSPPVVCPTAACLSSIPTIGVSPLGAPRPLPTPCTSGGVTEGCAVSRCVWPAGADRFSSCVSGIAVGDWDPLAGRSGAGRTSAARYNGRASGASCAFTPAAMLAATPETTELAGASPPPGPRGVPAGTPEIAELAGAFDALTRTANAMGVAAARVLLNIRIAAAPLSASAAEPTPYVVSEGSGRGARVFEVASRGSLPDNASVAAHCETVAVTAAGATASAKPIEAFGSAGAPCCPATGAGARVSFAPSWAWRAPFGGSPARLVFGGRASCPAVLSCSVNPVSREKKASSGSPLCDPCAGAPDENDASAFRGGALLGIGCALAIFTPTEMQMEGQTAAQSPHDISRKSRDANLAQVPFRHFFAAAHCSKTISSACKAAVLADSKLDRELHDRLRTWTN